MSELAQHAGVASLGRLSARCRSERRKEGSGRAGAVGTCRGCVSVPPHVILSMLIERPMKPSLMFRAAALNA